MRSRMKLAIAASSGNALEFYDFTTYAFFAIQIGAAFFPTHDPYTSLLASLATFGAGFVSRPLGAYVLGRYSDRHGRGPGMVASMAVMGVGITLLVLCPGYAQVGYLAPVIAVIARLLQGFALGGEVGASTAYLIECAPPEKRGTFIALQRASQLLAGLLGSLVGLVLSLVLTPEGFADYGWRIALGLGALAVPWAIRVRMRLPEHEETVPIEAAVASQGIETRTRLSRRRIYVGALLLYSGASTGGYIIPYMATFGQATMHFSPTISLASQVINSVIGIGFAFVGGILADRMGRRPANILGNSLCAVLGPISFALMLAAPGAGSFILATSVLAAFNTMHQPPMNAMVLESLPKHFRTLGFALIYTIPVTVIGGTSQVIITWLIHVTGSPMSVMWWTAAGCLISISGALLLRETAPTRIGTLNREQQTVASAM